MPFDGTGIFDALPPPYYPAIAGTTVKASYFNAVVDDLIAGLTNCMTRDGQSPPTNNLPMAGQRFTGVGDATSDTDFSSFKQLRNRTAAITAVAGLTNADYTLSAPESEKPIVTLAGTLTGNINLIFPATPGRWVIYNGTTGAFSVTCKNATGATLTAPQGGSISVWSSGSGIFMTSVALTGGILTGSLVLYGNAVTALEAVPLQQLQSYVPAGSMLDFAGETVPTGWLECDGASLLRASYPALFAAIGTLYGAADGTHFNLPDYRGRFRRGWDHGAGNDPDAASRTASNTGGSTGDHVGTLQLSAMQSHYHDVRCNSTTGSGTGGGGNFIQDTGVGVLEKTRTTGTGGVFTAETRPVSVTAMVIIKT